MTRWARAGNSQKHKKMPEDATSWEELSQGIKNPAKGKRKQSDSKEDKSLKNIRTHKNDFNNSKKFCKAELCNENQNVGEESLVFNSVEKNSICEVVKNSEESKIEEKTMSKRQLKKLKREERRKLKAEENRDCNETVKTTEPINVNRLSDKPMEELHSKSMKPNVKLSNMSEGKNLQENSQKRVNSSPNDKKLKKKELFMKKLQEKRAQNGITLLSKAAENRLYRIKKRLREKGYTPEMIKNIIRKERRKAELEFRKTTFTQICYNCGQPGHFRAECQVPNKILPSNNTIEEKESCQKCGSVEHNFVECTEKDFGKSFLTCFVCKGQGHISRDCPDKKRGSVKDEEEPVVALHTIDAGESIDDEIIDIGKNTEKTKFKKPKVVVF